MKALGEGGTELEQAAEEGIRAIASWDPASVRYAVAQAPVASPSHRATAHACVTVEVEGRRFFLSRLLADMEPFVDDDAAAAAASRGGELGVSPRVLARDPATRTTVFEHLAGDYRCGRVDDLAAPAVIERILAAKRALHRSPPLGRPRDPFAVVADYARQGREGGVTLPPDHAWLVHHVELIRRAVDASGRDAVPCHGDGVSSNVMLGPDGDVRLVDFDSAGDGDPYYDLASLIVEAHQFDDEVRATIERFDGRCSEEVFARCRLYGIVDDLLWGTWGLLAAAGTARADVEFYKYGEWRLLRCRHHLGDRRFEEWLRKV